MASQYELTRAMTPYLDRHMVGNMVQFLLEEKM